MTTPTRPPLQLDALSGLITRAIGEALWSAAQLVPAVQAIVEIGSYRGKSTAYLAHGAQLGAGNIVHAVDPWDLQDRPGRDYYGFANVATRRTFDNQLTEMGLRGGVIAWRGYSTDVAAEWPDAVSERIGLLYVDGDHTAAGVTADWNAWRPHLAAGATVIFDDYADDRNPGVREAVDRIIGDGDLVNVQTPVAARLLIATASESSSWSSTAFRHGE